MVKCIWGLDDDPDSNVTHIAENGLTREDVEHAIAHRTGADISRSSGRPIYYGPALDGDDITVVYERIDTDTIYPVTAFKDG